jgi:hypothetical protein
MIKMECKNCKDFKTCYYVLDSKKKSTDLESFINSVSDCHCLDFTENDENVDCNYLENFYKS